MAASLGTPNAPSSRRRRQSKSSAADTPSTCPRRFRDDLDGWIARAYIFIAYLRARSGNGTQSDFRERMAAAYAVPEFHATIWKGVNPDWEKHQRSLQPPKDPDDVMHKFFTRASDGAVHYVSAELNRLVLSSRVPDAIGRTPEAKVNRLRSMGVTTIPPAALDVITHPPKSYYMAQATAHDIENAIDSMQTGGFLTDELEPTRAGVSLRMPKSQQPTLRRVYKGKAAEWQQVDNALFPENGEIQIPEAILPLEMERFLKLYDHFHDGLDVYLTGEGQVAAWITRPVIGYLLTLRGEEIPAAVLHDNEQRIQKMEARAAALLAKVGRRRPAKRPREEQAPLFAVAAFRRNNPIVPKQAPQSLVVGALEPSPGDSQAEDDAEMAVKDPPSLPSVDVSGALATKTSPGDQEVMVAKLTRRWKLMIKLLGAAATAEKSEWPLKFLAAFPDAEDVVQSLNEIGCVSDAQAMDFMVLLQRVREQANA
jgi:hypothetical protein